MISHQEMMDIVATTVALQNQMKSIHASAAEIIEACKGQKASRFSRIRNHARFILEKTKI